MGTSFCQECQNCTYSKIMTISFIRPDKQKFLFYHGSLEMNTKVQQVYQRLKREQNISLVKLDKSKYGQVIPKPPMMETQSQFIYQGDWKDTIPHGIGRIITKSGQCYEGEIFNGIPTGQCKYIFADGDYFIGNIEEGLIQGRGKYHGEGKIINAFWKDSKPIIGTIQLYQKDRNITIELINDSGYGRITWQNNTVYHGNLLDLKPHGYGKVEFNNNFYQGDWKMGVFHGKGTFYWDTKQKYIGNYKDGLKHGYGQYFYPNKRVYKGFWQNGFQNGKGTLYQNDVQIFVGDFKDGVPIEKNQQEYKSDLRQGY